MSSFTGFAGTRLRPIVFVVFAMLLFGCNDAAESNAVAPSFKLQDLSGQTISLDQYRGQVVLLDFWATWCPPCRMSIPELIKLQEKYGEKLAILGISMDDPGQFSNQYLEAFKEKNRINYKILRYDPGVVQAYFGSESPVIPTMFIVDREGRLVDKIVGFRPDALAKAIGKLMK